VDRIDIFVVRASGKVEKKVAGTMIPFSKKDGFKRYNALPVTLADQEEITLYKRMHVQWAGSKRDLHIGFIPFETFIAERFMDEPWHRGDVRNWLIAGILFFGFFFNFFFFLIDRDRLYLYMALLLLTEGIWYLTVNISITFRESPYLREYNEIFISHCAFFTFVTLFVRKFLKTPQHYPRWDKVIVVLLVLMLVSAMFRTFYFPDVITRSTDITGNFTVASLFFALMASLLFSFIFCIKERGRLVTMSLVAAIPIFIYWSFGYFYLRILDYRLFVHNILPTGFPKWVRDNELVTEMFLMSWFAIFFTWIMLQRYALLRKQYVQQALDREKERSELANQQKVLLEKQVEERTAELRNSQAQLIHAEKMASLGELTAGIAHEIQNPLNFVNNFSDINKELIDEMEQEISKGNMEEVKGLAKNIRENQEKITNHGRRADSIVKGMLQHSRNSSGLKEPADINALADEYLRLAYHGLRARDKTFNAVMKTEFDESIGPVNVVQQDIGRVILNLITNAFYAVNEKRKKNPDGYSPAVIVQTRQAVGMIEILVRDNGDGIPARVREKIFQPFFTTKPSGEGTGLGLSLSYEIIKAHGGELVVNSKEGQGTDFIIQLPYSKPV
jgi:two-component system NtrC family sensor kinase